MKYKLNQLSLIAVHKIYSRLFGSFNAPEYPRIYGDNEVSAIIADAIDQETPFMVSRFGAVEIGAVFNYIGVSSQKRDFFGYIRGKEPEWWWNEGIRRCMTDNAGFFPNTDENMLRFGALMLQSMKEIDILTSWQSKERFFDGYLHCKNYINYIQVDPFWADDPWTAHLKGKKVLVIHPFANEIKSQYENKREKLFANKNVLPEFTLITYKAVQSIGGSSQYKDWFEALDKMEQDISQIDFDICLLGCGAYGMPLAAYIKKELKRSAIHIGGSLQLFFGIKGHRWENPEYGLWATKEYGRYPSLFNEFWIRPFEASSVKGAEKVDDNCYW